MLNTPEQLTLILENLILTSSERLNLNKRMANHSRQYFRGQIRTQSDIDGKRYTARKRQKITLDSKTQKAKNNKNMLMGFSRALKTTVTDKSFEVGLAGLVGKIARVHNEGQGVSFSTHVNGFFNSKTSQWEGGTLTKHNYTMTKRTFIGWTPALERELLAMVGKSLTSKEASLND